MPITQETVWRRDDDATYCSVRWTGAELAVHLEELANFLSQLGCPGVERQELAAIPVGGSVTTGVSAYVRIA